MPKNLMLFTLVSVSQMDSPTHQALISPPLLLGENPLSEHRGFRLPDMVFTTTGIPSTCSLLSIPSGLHLYPLACRLCLAQEPGANQT